MDPFTAHSAPLAGPSSAPPVVFPPPQPLPYPPQYLHSTQDLLAVFNLLPAYDRYVRPHVHPIVDSNGKGKEREVPPVDGAVDRLGAEDHENGGKKKKKESYRHLIKRTPGKHSTKKDDYFQTLMSVPPKQNIRIQPIDAKTLLEGFSVTLTGLPSYNKAALEGTDPKEKELKRLKKERRKAEKERLRLQQELAQGSASSASTPAAVSTPRAGATPGSSALHVRNVTTTNKPVISARPGSTRPGTPKPSTTGAQQRTASIPAATQPNANTAGLPRVTPNPVVAGSRRPPTGSSVEVTPRIGVAEKRGQKRELDAQQPTPGAMPTAASNGLRPQKKRRLESTTPQPTPLQQPTPHGS